MDIEKLTKSQIILLTLLISFVTSIATGIVTVSLMDQAPPVVAETVNRVIENTIETVATSTAKAQPAAAVVTEQKTVIVNESGLVAQAVKQASPSLVKIFTDDSSDGTPGKFLGLGIVVDASGTVVADIGALGEEADAQLQLPDGTMVHSFVTSRDTTSGLLDLTPGSSTAQVTWTPATLAPIDPALGENVVVLSGEKVPEIAAGFVTLIVPSDATDPETIGTDIDPAFIMSGSPLIDTDGNVIGVSTGISRASLPSAFIPASDMSPLGVKEAQGAGQ